MADQKGQYQKLFIRLKNPFGIAVILALAVSLICIYFTFFLIDYQRDGLPLLLVISTAIYVVLLWFALVVFARGYMTYQRRYRGLEPQEKYYIQHELRRTRSLNTMLFGDHYCYFYHSNLFDFLVFLSYDDIVWAYLEPPKAKFTDVANDTPHNPVALVIYDTEGNRYVLRTRKVLQQGPAILEELRQRSPTALIGYQRKVRKAARQILGEKIRV